MTRDMSPSPDWRAAAAAPDFAALSRALAGLDLDRLPPEAWQQLAEAAARLAAAAGIAPLRLACLGNFTLDLLPACVAVRAAAEGLAIACHVGAYGQYVQEVLAEDGPLAAFRPDLVLLALSLPRLRPEAMGDLGALPPAARRELAGEVVDHLAEWAALAAARLPATLLLANFVAPAHPAAGVADAKDPYGETELYLDLNLALLRRFKDEPRVQVLDADRLAAVCGKARALDRRLAYLAAMDWSPELLPLVAGEVVRQARAARGLARKCLVLDLDGTLWGGTVGEDGAAGVRIGRGDPEGEAYLELQQRLKALERRGVLLALCSKNNPEDAREVFATRPEMALSWDDFAAVAIGWEGKHEGLARIAAELGIGLDSLVFLDDNPAEVSLVEQLLPEVKALLLPQDPAELVPFLDRLTDFEKPAVLPEDAAKTAQYRAEGARRALAARLGAGGSLDAYLASLETAVALRRAAAADLPRAHQLFAKTNQFNLTVRRLSLPELERLAADPAALLGLAAARDRFGDLGTIGAFLLRAADGGLEIDSFLLSCRALGRGVESAMMNEVKRLFLAGGPASAELRARFVPTGKNRPAEGFLEREGFRAAGEEEGARLYVLPRGAARVTPCPWIAVAAAGLAAPAVPAGAHEHTRSPSP